MIWEKDLPKSQRREGEVPIHIWGLWDSLRAAAFLRQPLL